MSFPGLLISIDDLEPERALHFQAESLFVRLQTHVTPAFQY